MQVTAAENFLIPNGTIVVEFVIFAVVLLVLWRVILPPLVRAMDERQALLRRQLEEGQAAAERAAQAEQEYREAAAEARAESTRIREEARARGQQLSIELKEKAAAEYEQMSAANDAQLAAEREEIMAALQPEIRKLATELSGRIVGEPLSDTGNGARRPDPAGESLSRGRRETH